MYIDIVPNRNSPPAILLRESIRQGKKIVKQTIANLSNLSIEQAQAIRRILKGEKLVQPEAHFTLLNSRAHGHAEAVLLTIRRLGFDKLIASRRCKERDLVIAMIASRILGPESKLALSRSWENTTLGESLGVDDADEDALYAAMDWLYERQEPIEKRLNGICRLDAGYCMTFPPVILKGSNARWRHADTAVIRRKESCRLTTVY